MKTHSVETYTATIYCGYRKGYGDGASSFSTAFDTCREYCNKVGLGLTFTNTYFIYTDGYEDGVAIGLINYPRFPSTKARIRKDALELAKRLKERCEQIRVSIVFPDKTVMLGEK